MLTLRTTPTFDRSFDRAFDQLVGSFFDQRRTASGPVVDAGWQGDAYVLTVDLPGVPASAVAVEVAGQTLSLSATTPTLDWQRSVRLGARLDPDKVEANHVDGRLTVRIGTVDAPTSRRIEIGATPFEALALEAESTDSTAVDAGEPESGDQPTETNSAG